jgi:hypothetical protein
MDRVHVIFLATGLLIGATLGYYFALYMQAQIALLAVGTIAFALAWFGSGADIVGLLQKWHSDRQEKIRRLESLPKLTIFYDAVNLDDSEPTGDRWFESKPEFHFKRKSIRLTIRNDGGSVAEKCRATMANIIRVDGCTCPARNTKYLRWLSGLTEQDIHPHGNSEILELVFGDSLEFTPIDAICKVQKTDKAKIIAWASTHDNLTGQYHNENGFCSGHFEFIITVFPRNTDSVTKKVLLEVGNTYTDLRVTLP